MFDIIVGVHQRSTQSPLLFLLYAGDLVLTGQSKQEVDGMVVQWKTAMECRVLNVNIGKTKMMVSDGSDVDPVQLGIYSCAVCDRGLGDNCMLCTQCGKWFHKTCSGLHTLRVGHAFVLYAQMDLKL